jgi:DNA modification methylase
MRSAQQLDLLSLSMDTPNRDTLIDAGTFKESMRAPIHGWFRYPAGYSYRFVENVFEQQKLRAGAWVYDPFSGSGTTLLCAQFAGMNGYGVEAHPFVQWVASVKLEQDYPIGWQKQITSVLSWAYASVRDKTPRDLSGYFPDLVYKFYHPTDLLELYRIREVLVGVENPVIREFLKLALTDTLRSAAAAGTGWPYIAPRKNTGDKPPQGAFTLFEQTTLKMIHDVEKTASFRLAGETHNVLGDSRERQSLAEESIDLALTSPPYLNNFDYADRTRLETYFWGLAHSWGDITRLYRDRLMVAATTQITRRLHNPETTLASELHEVAPDVYATLQSAVLQLSLLRPTKGGKKDYDLLVALYFNGIFSMLRETYRLLRPGGAFYLVLGDSAPYGVHIATDELIGQLGVAVGFKTYRYQQFRTRGDKWKANPQRHTVPLHEGVIILSK